MPQNFVVYVEDENGTNDYIFKSLDDAHSFVELATKQKWGEVRGPLDSFAEVNSTMTRDSSGQWMHSPA